MRQGPMNGNTEAPLCHACRQIPLSHLALDVSEPLVGWERFFSERSIEVFEDACGRPSVARHVLTRLLDEQREREARLAEEAEASASTLEQPVAVGVPAIEDGDAYASMMAAGAVSPAEEFGAIPRPTSSPRSSRPALGARRRSKRPSDGGRRRSEHREP